MVPQRIGITSFRTNDYGFEGKLFKEKEDFTVLEIESDGKVLDISKPEVDAIQPGEKQDFLVFTLVKKGLSTSEAIKFIAKDNGLSIKRIGYLGNKDRNAVTTQKISIFKFDVNRLKREYPKMFLKDLEYSAVGCKIGELRGNRFRIRIRDFNGKEEDLRSFISQAHEGIPNFYGPQHFGASALNIELSKAIFNSDFKTAIIKFLTEERDESATAMESRGMIRKTFLPYLSDDVQLDKTKAFEVVDSLPGFFYLEKSILRALISNSHDYVGAFRLVPKYLRLLILQSFQAYLFNLTLSEALDKKDVPARLPTVGYDLDSAKIPTSILDMIKRIASENGISDMDKLKVRQMPEADLKTFERDTLIRPENISYFFDENDLMLSFDLRAGAYATIFLYEMFRHFA